MTVPLWGSNGQLIKSLKWVKHFKELVISPLECGYHLGGCSVFMHFLYWRGATTATFACITNHGQRWSNVLSTFPLLCLFSNQTFHLLKCLMRSRGNNNVKALIRESDATHLAAQDKTKASLNPPFVTDHGGGMPDVLLPNSTHQGEVEAPPSLQLACPGSWYRGRDYT